ncbi:MAG: PilZ domain-containing protein [Sulfobacillus acidophilus]|uniref:PilZ domain-containing protein n=1 Tax=Sulfobacillus acidophilus TaxID=53633 RepID=A0A2T2WM76_9FIRM|nr:MAG: PilZ domain-containing protein [Sulfobacillus acidophilus]
MALESNQPIQIVVANRIVPTRVIRSMPNEVYLDALKDTEVELTPLPGQKVPLRWAEDETLYQQFAMVTDVLDPIPIIVVRLQGTAHVVEFRKSFRVKVSVPIEYGLVRPDSELLVTTTQDLSATGLRFPSAVRLWTGIELRMRIRVESRPIELVGKVVRVAPKAREVRGRESWETAVQYTAITTADRRWLEQYVRRQHTRMRIGGPR